MNSDIPTRARKSQIRSPMRGQVLHILCLFVMASLILITIGYLQSETFNSVRSFVRGEGLWGKAQKDATFYLEQYALTGRDLYYDKFLTALEVNLGDKQARLALSQPEPDLDLARAGFLKGGNHPEDVDSLISFYLRFENFYYMQEAIKVWTQGDHEIENLLALGEELHTCIKGPKSQKCTPALIDSLEQLNETLNSIAIEFSLVLSEGARWIKSTIMTINVIIIFILALGIYFISRKILNKLDKNERELIFSEDRFLSLYNANVIGMIDWKVNGEIVSANDAFLNMLGYKKPDIKNLNLNWKKLTFKKDEEKDLKAAEEIAKHGVCRPYEKTFVHKDGHEIPVLIGSAILQGVDNQGISFVLDQTIQKQSETQLKLSATIFEASRDGMLIMDKHKHVVAANKAYCEQTGKTEAELLGVTPPILDSQIISTDVYAKVSESLAEHGHWRGDISQISKANENTYHLNISAVRDSHYKVSHYVAVVSDISNRKEMELKLKQMAHFDFLTGLANRSLYNDRLKHSLARAKRHKKKCALLFFDLDRFKPVNDQFGHEMGDILLQKVAKRIQQQTRDNDTIARLGGDEFVIILEDIDQVEHVARFAEKVIQIIAEPFMIKDVVLSIGCSIGISLYPDDAKDPISLTRNADIAMYSAKGSGRNCFYFFNQNYRNI